MLSRHVPRRTVALMIEECTCVTCWQVNICVSSHAAGFPNHRRSNNKPNVTADLVNLETVVGKALKGGKASSTTPELMEGDEQGEAEHDGGHHAWAQKEQMIRNATYVAVQQLRKQKGLVDSYTAPLCVVKKVILRTKIEPGLDPLAVKAAQKKKMKEKAAKRVEAAGDSAGKENPTAGGKTQKKKNSTLTLKEGSATQKKAQKKKKKPPNKAEQSKATAEQANALAHELLKADLDQKVKRIRADVVGQMFAEEAKMLGAMVV